MELQDFSGTFVALLGLSVAAVILAILILKIGDPKTLTTRRRIVIWMTIGIPYVVHLVTGVLYIVALSLLYPFAKKTVQEEMSVESWWELVSDIYYHFVYIHSEKS